MWVVELNLVNQDPYHHQGTDIQKRKDTKKKKLWRLPKSREKTHHFPGRLSNDGKCGNAKGRNVHHPSTES